MSCASETPTGSRFAQSRSLRVEVMQAQGETAKLETDALRSPPPQPKC